MKISVLIPTFNRELYIREAIESILNQTYKDLDIIVYDDGSTDRTLGIIKCLQLKDRRIRLIQGSTNRGIGYARNQLLNACNTPFAIWQDSDDISEPTRIEKQFELISKYPTLIFCGWTWMAYHKRKKKWVNKANNSNHLAFASLLFPVKKDIQFNDKLKIGGEDWNWIEKMRAVLPEEQLIPSILYTVRYHDDRIGAWKKKFRKNIKKELLGKLSYKELIEYYKRKYD